MTAPLTDEQIEAMLTSCDVSDQVVPALAELVRAASNARWQWDRTRAALAEAVALLSDPPIGGMNPHNDEWLRISYAFLAKHGGAK